MNDKTIKWDDSAVIHSCHGERMVPFDQGTFLVWTDCSKDVPANKGFRSDSVSANCSGCSAAIKAANQ